VNSPRSVVQRGLRLAAATAAALMALLLAGVASAQVPILYYDFENNTTRTTFENLVEQQVNAGSGAITRAGIPVWAQFGITPHTALKSFVFDYYTQLQKTASAK